MLRQYAENSYPWQDHPRFAGSMRKTAIYPKDGIIFHSDKMPFEATFILKFYKTRILVK